MFTSLKKRREFLLFRKVQKTFNCDLFFIKAMNGNGFAGIVVTKKLGNAVVRNRIKRRLRAAFNQVIFDNTKNYLIVAKYSVFYCVFSDIVLNMEKSIRHLS